jgi:hypothetical protein
MQRRAARIKRKFRRAFANDGMPRFLDALFGPGTWSYDKRERLWIVPDTTYRGPGREYFCINIKGDWIKARMPGEGVQ